MIINEEITTKEQAESLIEKLKGFEPKLEFNRWHLTNKEGFENWIGFHDTEKNIIYGINCDGDWYLSTGCYSLTGNRYATKEEVETRLFAYAEKMGYKKGVFYIDPSSKKKIKAKGKMEIWQSGKVNGINFSRSEGLILKDGVWAEIVEEPKTDSQRITELEERIAKLENK